MWTITRSFSSKSSSYPIQPSVVWPWDSSSAESIASVRDTGSDDKKDEREGEGEEEDEHEDEEEDEIARWERWRARVLAARSPVPPFVFSLRKRRLPPQADGRFRTVPCRECSPATNIVYSADTARRPKGFSSQHSDQAVSGSRTKSQMSLMLPASAEAPPKTPTFPRKLPKSRPKSRQAYAKVSPDYPHANDKLREISIYNLKHSQQSKEGSTKPICNSTVESCVKGQLARLHSQDDSFRAHSNSVSGGRGRFPQSFERHLKTGVLDLSRPNVQFVLQTYDTKRTDLTSDFQAPPKSKKLHNEHQQNHEYIKPKSAQEPIGYHDKKHSPKTIAHYQNFKSQTRQLQSQNTIRESPQTQQIIHKNKTETRKSKSSSTSERSSLGSCIYANGNKKCVNLEKIGEKTRTTVRKHLKPGALHQEQKDGYSEATINGSREAVSTEGTLLSENSSKKQQHRQRVKDYIVKVICSGIVTYEPKFNSKDINVLKKKNPPKSVPKQTSSQQQKRVGIQEVKDTSTNSNRPQARDRILKHTEGPRDEKIQCPLKQICKEFHAIPKDCVSPTTLSNTSESPNQLLSEDSVVKHRTVKFEFSEADEVQKPKKSSVIRNVPDLLEEQVTETTKMLPSKANHCSHVMSISKSPKSVAVNEGVFKPNSKILTMCEIRGIEPLSPTSRSTGQSDMMLPLGIFTNKYCPQDIRTNKLPSQEFRQCQISPSKCKSRSSLTPSVSSEKIQGNLCIREIFDTLSDKLAMPLEAPPSEQHENNSQQLFRCFGKFEYTIPLIEKEDMKSRMRIRLCSGTTNIHHAFAGNVTMLGKICNSSPKHNESKVSTLSYHNPSPPSRAEGTSQRTPLASPEQPRSGGVQPETEPRTETAGKELRVLYSSADKSARSPPPPPSLPPLSPLDRTGMAKPCPLQPDFAKLQPPWPDAGRVDVHRQPPPPRNHEQDARAVRLRARELRALALCQQPTVDVQNSSAQTYPSGESSLHYLRKRLLEEQMAMGALNKRRRKLFAWPNAAPLCPSRTRDTVSFRLRTSPPLSSVSTVL